MQPVEAISAAFCCSITFDVMKDPVILAGTGHTYERAAIEEWLATSGKDPITSKVLKKNDRTLIPNHAIRTAIEEWKHRKWNSLN